MNYDEQIGQNLTTLRGDRSQKDVAEAMRAAGWRWSQATVWSIEKGERPLRLAEAADLTEVLLCQIGDLLASDGHARFRSAQRNVSTLSRGIETQIDQYTTALYFLAVYADELGDDLQPHEARAVESWISITPSAMFKRAYSEAIIKDRLDGALEGADGVISSERDRELRTEAGERAGKWERIVQAAFAVDEAELGDFGKFSDAMDRVVRRLVEDEDDG